MDDESTPESGRSGYHHGDLRASLLSTAMEMLEAGESFSLRAVAREALESALAVQGFDDLRRRLSADGANPASVEELVGFAVTYVAFALERPALFTLMFGRECDDSDDERVRAAGELHALLADSLGDVCPDRDPGPLATALWPLTHGLAFLHLDGKLPAASSDDVATRVRTSFAALGFS